MRVERAMETGDIPMALRHLATLIRFGKLVEEDADTLISLAFAVSVVESACENLKDIARGQNITEETLEPKFLPSVPTAPFDCGKVLNYGPGRGIIWTVGPDGKVKG